MCPVQTAIPSPLQIDILVHRREQHRPSSTGHLIARCIPNARQHAWQRGLAVDTVKAPDRELWVLHPHGAPPPPDRAASDVQVVLLDGAWKEASAMAQEVSHWGRLVSLPMRGESRYWLRSQADGARFSTVEALLFVLRHFGLSDAADALQLQFELHVYANLRARGSKEKALEFLATSPIATAFADFIAQLDIRRPR
jgi:DTW domain-containing protein YfiP